MRTPVHNFQVYGESNIIKADTKNNNLINNPDYLEEPLNVKRYSQNYITKVCTKFIVWNLILVVNNNI